MSQTRGIRWDYEEEISEISLIAVNLLVMKCNESHKER